MASAVFTARSQSASLVTSWRTNFAASPSSFASAVPSFSSTSPITTLPPSATSALASAAPWPRAPPLMSVILPSNRAMAVLPFFLFRHQILIGALIQHPDNGAHQACRQRARHDRLRAERDDVLAPLGRHRRQPADQDRKST